MAQRLDDKLAREAPPPKGGKKAYLIIYDGGHARAVKGFGLRVTQAGARSWVLNYRTAGVERRLTIGSFPDWKAGPARDEAARLKRLVDQGRDPMRERHELRGAPTVKNLADRYLAEHAIKKRTGDADKAMIVKIIVPALGNRKVADVQFTDIDKLHRDVSKCTPIRANRVAALLSKMFSLAIKWQIRETNPCKGIERNHEDKRERYLSPDEMARLVAALNASKAPGQRHPARAAHGRAPRRNSLDEMGGHPGGHLGEAERAYETEEGAPPPDLGASAAAALRDAYRSRAQGEEVPH